MNTEISIAEKRQRVFIGLDVHLKQYTVHCRVDGAVAKRCTMPASPELLMRFIGHHFPGYDVYTGYEAGFCGYGLHRTLLKAGVHSAVVHPGAVEVSKKRVRTDKRDARKIAEQLESGRLVGIQVPSEEQERSRLLPRTRAQLVRARARLKNQVRSRFHQFSLLSAADQEVITLPKANSVLKKTNDERLNESVSFLMEAWKAFDQQITAIDKVLRVRDKEDPAIVTYRKLPGIGPKSASVLASELGDLSQFSNEKKLFSYLGLTPSEDSSDEKRRLGHVSHQGRPLLRAILVECAWAAVRCDPGLAEAYHRISVKAGGKRAIVAIARKLAGRARAIFRKKEEYKRELVPAA